MLYFLVSNVGKFSLDVKWDLTLNLEWTKWSETIYQKSVEAKLYITIEKSAAQ